MYLIFPYDFALKINLSSSYLRYLKSRYAGYYTDALKGKLTGTVNFGENLLELQHDIIRPPVGIGKTLFCLIILLIHFTANFHDIGVKDLNISISSNLTSFFRKPY